MYATRLLNLAVELKRRLVVVLETNRRAEVAPEVETVVGGENERSADWNHTRRDFLAIECMLSLLLSPPTDRR